MSNYKERLSENGPQVWEEGVRRITAAAAKELLTSSRRDPVSRVCAVILHANAAKPIF